jgi:hypothetical protein
MQNYNEQSIYFGSIPLILAVGALFADSKKRSFVIIAFLALCCMAVAWRLPGFEVINHLPIFSMADNGRLKLPFVFLAATMAGFGFDVFYNHLRFNQQDKKSFYMDRTIFFVSLMVFLAVITLHVIRSFTEISLEPFDHLFLFPSFSFQQLQLYVPLISMFLALIGYFFYLRYRQFFLLTR